MRATVVTVENDTSAWIPVDTWKASFRISAAVVTDGLATWNLEITYDDVQNPAVTVTPFAVPDILDETTNGVAEFEFPFKAIRLITSGGSATMTVLQAG